MNANRLVRAPTLKRRGDPAIRDLETLRGVFERPSSEPGGSTLEEGEEIPPRHGERDAGPSEETGRVANGDSEGAWDSPMTGPEDEPGRGSRSREG